MHTTTNTMSFKFSFIRFLAVAKLMLLVFVSSASLLPSRAEFLFDPLFVVIDAPTGRGTASITISNPFEKPARLQLSVSAWEVDKNNQFHIVEKALDDKSDITQYIRISPRQFTIQPNQEKTIRVACKIPNNFEDREYKLFLNMLEIGADRKMQTDNASGKAMGLVVNKEFRAGTYIRKGDPDKLQSEFKVQDIEILKNIDGQVTYHMIFTNTGNMHVRKDLGLRFYEAGSGNLVGETPFAGTILGFVTDTKQDRETITVSKSFVLPKELDKTQAYDVQFIIKDSIRNIGNENNPIQETAKFRVMKAEPAPPIEENTDPRFRNKKISEETAQ